MDIKLVIKEKARALFCEKGFKNVTLREVAKALNKSYGNITYHYRTKKEVCSVLLDDFIAELSTTYHRLAALKDPFATYKLWPKYHFECYQKYRFLLCDFHEITRSYSESELSYSLKTLLYHSKKKQLLHSLQEKGYLLKNLTLDRMEYILELETALTQVYFQHEQGDQKSYQKKMNCLLYPYLTYIGKLKYIRS